MNSSNIKETLFNQLRQIEQAKKQGSAKDVSAAKTKFDDILKDFIHDVNDLQSVANESIEKLAAGEITDVHEVMVAVEKAGVAFDLMMEIRNKMLEAYQEIMRMQV